MNEVLTELKLAELSLNDTLIKLSREKDLSDRDAAKYFAEYYEVGINGDIRAALIDTHFKYNVIVGRSELSPRFKRDEIEFEPREIDVKKLKSELINMWTNFIRLPKQAQEAHTTALLAWVAGESEYPKLP